MSPAQSLQCLRECRANELSRQGVDAAPVPVSKGCSGVPAPGQDLAVNVNGNRASAPAHLQCTRL